MATMPEISKSCGPVFLLGPCSNRLRQRKTTARDPVPTTMNFRAKTGSWDILASVGFWKKGLSQLARGWLPLAGDIVLFLPDRTRIGKWNPSSCLASLAGGAKLKKAGGSAMIILLYRGAQQRTWASTWAPARRLAQTGLLSFPHPRLDPNWRHNDGNPCQPCPPAWTLAGFSGSLPSPNLPVHPKQSYSTFTLHLIFTLRSKPHFPVRPDDPNYS